MKPIIVDAGPFTHLAQINQITILKKFPIIYTSTSVISEINRDKSIPINEIRQWKNINIIDINPKSIYQIEKVVKRFKLHPADRDILYIAAKLNPSMVFTDDLDVRNACKSLAVDVHGTVGIISYAFHSKWISLKTAEGSLLLLYRRSTLFITSAIIERAVVELRK